MVLVPELMLPSESSSSKLEFDFCIFGLWGLNVQSAEVSASGAFIIQLILQVYSF